jgi:hypothetical protein
MVTGTNSRVVIQDSIIRQNNAGVVAASGTGVTLNHVTLDGNSTTAVTVPAALSGGLVVGTGSTAVLSNSTLTGDNPGISNAGSVLSYGNNVIRGVMSGTAITPTQPQ